MSIGHTNAGCPLYFVPKGYKFPDPRRQPLILTRPAGQLSPRVRPRPPT